MHQVPYADAGGIIVDSRPLFYVVEFYVTPFDRIVWDVPEQSLVSDLYAGKTIGFAMTMMDTDTETKPLLADRAHVLLGPDASFDEPDKLAYESNLWAQGILLGADGRTHGTPVESVSWGRIKASLSTGNHLK